MGLPGGTVVKNSPANAEDARDAGLIPGSGRSPGEGNGSPLQYSCLGNPIDRGAWWAIVHGGHKYDLAAKPPPLILLSQVRNKAICRMTTIKEWLPFRNYFQNY